MTLASKHNSTFQGVKDFGVMSRRGSPAVQILVVVVVVLFFLYGFYSYHEQHTRLKHSEELSEKYKQKSESLSAQLQGDYNSHDLWLQSYFWTTLRAAMGRL